MPQTKSPAGRLPPGCPRPPRATARPRFGRGWARTSSSMLRRRHLGLGDQRAVEPGPAPRPPCARPIIEPLDPRVRADRCSRSAAPSARPWCPFPPSSRAQTTDWGPICAPAVRAAAGLDAASPGAAARTARIQPARAGPRWPGGSAQGCRCRSSSHPGKAVEAVAHEPGEHLALDGDGAPGGHQLDHLALDHVGARVDLARHRAVGLLGEVEHLAVARAPDQAVEGGVLDLDRGRAWPARRSPRGRAAGRSGPCREHVAVERQEAVVEPLVERAAAKRVAPAVPRARPRRRRAGASRRVAVAERLPQRSDMKPQARIASVTPWPFSQSIMKARNGRSTRGMAGLGMVSVSGRRRVPSPRRERLPARAYEWRRLAASGRCPRTRSRPRRASPGPGSCGRRPGAAGASPRRPPPSPARANSGHSVTITAASAPSSASRADSATRAPPRLALGVRCATGSKTRTSAPSPAAARPAPGSWPRARRRCRA